MQHANLHHHSIAILKLEGMIDLKCGCLVFASVDRDIVSV
jgi:hypothetical protein